MGTIFALAHISDLHATPPAPGGLGPLLGKRALGWLSWQVKRRHAHQGEVLEALLRDLEADPPDHLAITGDLTNLSLPHEFEDARRWLVRLGPPERVTAVPGNHDAYVPIAEARSWGLWSDYLVPDAEGGALLADLHGDLPPDDGKDGRVRFPSLRIRDGVALVGLCSARPTPPLFASGSLGREQRERLASLLAELGSRGLARVVLLHHPPAPGALSPRRALDDAEALCDVLRRVGGELVLHGHAHRTRIGAVPGPTREVPVVGVRSASNADTRPGRLARYHRYAIEGEGAGVRIRLHERAYDPESGTFGPEGPPEGLLLAPGA